MGESIMPLSHIQERLHRAYVNAVVAMAGLKLVWDSDVEYGVDCHMQDVKPTPGGMSESGPILQFQLKSTINWKLKENKIIYDMESIAYNKLINAEGRLLILYCLPVKIAEWLNVNDKELILRRCCYWYYVSGPLSNGSKKRIFIPNDQLFISSCLRDLLHKLAAGEFSHERNPK